MRLLCIFSLVNTQVRKKKMSVLNWLWAVFVTSSLVHQIATF